MQNLSVCFTDSSPIRGALGKPGHFVLPAKSTHYHKRPGLAYEGRCQPFFTEVKDNAEYYHP